MKEIPSPEPTPEQLVQLLDAQLAAHRSQRTKSGRNRAIILVSGVLFIVVAAGAALLILDQMLMDMRENAHSTSTPTITSGVKN
ncbi:MAG TPA: hypothetical protein VGM54_20785 [Chthoniobacter sp.]